MERNLTTEILAPLCEEGDAATTGASSEGRGNRLPGQRGRQKRPTKVLITMRFSPQVLAFFKATGDGWQTRINDVLCAHVNSKNTEHPQNQP